MHLNGGFVKEVSGERGEAIRRAAAEPRFQDGHFVRGESQRQWLASGTKNEELLRHSFYWKRVGVVVAGHPGLVASRELDALDDLIVAEQLNGTITGVVSPDLAGCIEIKDGRKVGHLHLWLCRRQSNVRLNADHAILNRRDFIRICAEQVVADCFDCQVEVPQDASFALADLGINSLRQATFNRAEVSC